MPVELLDHAHLSGETIEKLVRRGVSHEGIELDDCTLSRCDFAGGAFYRCLFDECRLVDCDLSNVAVTNARFVEVRFLRCKLIGVDWTKAGDTTASKLGLSIIFEECTLDYGNFFGLDLRQTRFLRCTAREADFSEARLAGVDCSGTDFTRAKFLHTDLSRADLRDARNYRISPTANTVKKARFSLPEAVSLLAEFDVVIDSP